MPPSSPPHLFSQDPPDDDVEGFEQEEDGPFDDEDEDGEDLFQEGMER
jgi:hypothetical protein